MTLHQFIQDNLGAFVVGGTVGIVAGVVTGTLTTLLGKVTEALNGLVFVRKELKGAAAEMLLYHLRRRARSISIGKETYTGFGVYLKPRQFFAPIFYRMVNESQKLFFLGRVPVFVTPAIKTEKSEIAPAVVYVRWTLDLEKLMVEATVDFHKKYQAVWGKAQRHSVSRYFGTRGAAQKEGESVETPTGRTHSPEHTDWSRQPIGFAEEEIGYDKKKNPGLQNLSLTSEAIGIVKDVEFWTANKPWYQDRSITWKRGYALQGKPGSGKTSLIRGIAEHFDLPVCIMDLASMTNKDLNRYWAEARSEAPCIILIEDIDGVFHGRVSQQAGADGLTFDTLLNCIDGLEQRDGILLFVTTNHIQHVDTALLRPGRIDVMTELPDLDYSCRLKMAQRILKNGALAEQLARSHAACTAAKFQEVCTQQALNGLWEKQELAS